jgi:hypothetical protein
MSTMSCAHDGFHTGQGRYDEPTGRLRYVMVCDECQQEIGQVAEVPYQPRYDPHGNDSFPKAA